jgi:hypothetical protein
LSQNLCRPATSGLERRGRTPRHSLVTIENTHT